MSTRFFVAGGIALALIISGVILGNVLLGFLGILGVITALRFVQLDRWKDSEQRELYLPTYKKEWEDKKRPR